jgi:hypothetical protein
MRAAVNMTPTGRIVPEAIKNVIHTTHGEVLALDTFCPTWPAARASSVTQPHHSAEKLRLLCL